VAIPLRPILPHLEHDEAAASAVRADPVAERDLVKVALVVAATTDADRRFPVHTHIA
jgi:hypothetical protein